MNISKHSLNKVWIHLIWETPDKQKILPAEARKKISNFLYNYCKEKNIFMKINYVNADHVHAVVDLPTNLSIENCIKLLKGSSSFYINKYRIINNKFSWGVGYGAFSISPSQLNKVIDYVKNQEEHHRIKSFTEEYRLFIEKYSAEN